MIAKKIKIEMHDLRSEERAKLVEELKSLGISNTKLLKAFLKVRRELFVGKDFLRFAYDNNALPINSNQTISQPFTVAYMTHFLMLKITIRYWKSELVPVIRQPYCVKWVLMFIPSNG